jgi:hypothetical protein
MKVAIAVAVLVIVLPTIAPASTSCTLGFGRDRQLLKLWPITPARYRARAVRTGRLLHTA